VTKTSRRHSIRARGRLVELALLLALPSVVLPTRAADPGLAAAGVGDGCEAAGGRPVRAHRSFFPEASSYCLNQ